MREKSTSPGRKVSDTQSMTRRVFSSLSLIHILENFILGFRRGVRMILEALDEDDGSLIDPNKEG